MHCTFFATFFDILKNWICFVHRRGFIKGYYVVRPSASLIEPKNCWLILKLDCEFVKRRRNLQTLWQTDFFQWVLMLNMSFLFIWVTEWFIIKNYIHVKLTTLNHVIRINLLKKGVFVPYFFIILSKLCESNSRTCKNSKEKRYLIKNSFEKE